MNELHPSDPVEPRPPRDERLARLLHACCAASEELAGGQYAGLGPAITGPQRQKRERAAAMLHDYVEMQLRGVQERAAETVDRAVASNEEHLRSLPPDERGVRPDGSMSLSSVIGTAIVLKLREAAAAVRAASVAPYGSGAVLAFPRQPVSYRLEPYHTDAGDVMTGVACDDASLTFDGRFVCVIPGPPGIAERVGRALLRALSARA